MVFRTGARARPTRSTVDAMPRDARRQRARARVERARDDARASTSGAALRDASIHGDALARIPARGAARRRARGAKGRDARRGASTGRARDARRRARRDDATTR
jgi:hypothetical protein